MSRVRAAHFGALHHSFSVHHLMMELLGLHFSVVRAVLEFGVQAVSAIERDRRKRKRFRKEHIFRPFGVKPRPFRDIPTQLFMDKFRCVHVICV